MKILERQIETSSFKNCYIFSGPSGCGKTTLARIFASMVNKGRGEPIEIDGASNNSVENVRTIIDSAQERSLDSEYKIYIIDECHMLTTQAWNAFLKCIEEPPKYTIFIFCTTDPQKIPATIVNRCQVHTLGKIKVSNIVKRLSFICRSEGYRFDDSALDMIAKMSSGSMRQAISYLDKCKDFSADISPENVRDCLGDYSYDVMFNLTNMLIDGNSNEVIELIDKLYFTGTDLKIFVSNYLEFILQVVKFLIVGKDITLTTIPSYYNDQLMYLTNIEGAVDYFRSMMYRVLDIKKSIKVDDDIKTTFEIMLLKGGE